MDEMNKIIDNLYISNWNKSNDITELKNNNIKAIIHIDMQKKPSDVLKYYRDNNIEYLFLYLNDLPSENINTGKSVNDRVSSSGKN